MKWVVLGLEYQWATEVDENIADHWKIVAVGECLEDVIPAMASRDYWTTRLLEVKE